MAASFFADQKLAGGTDTSRSLLCINRRPAVDVTPHRILNQQVGEVRFFKLHRLGLVKPPKELGHLLGGVFHYSGWIACAAQMVCGAVDLQARMRPLATQIGDDLDAVEAGACEWAEY